MNTLDLLKELCQVSGVSGDEVRIAEKSSSLLEKYGKTVIDNRLGNVTCYVGEFDDAKQTVLLDAHMDEIGLIVNSITDDGFLKVSACGGIDNRVLAAQQVAVLGKQKLVGVITSTPPHLEKDSSEIAELDSMYVDVGLSGERAKELVSLGDRVLIENTLQSLIGDRVTAKAIDDRSGMTAILLALDMLQGKKTKYNIIVLFSSLEEVGERGAICGGFSQNADIAIAVDVSFAKTHFESEEECGIMGNGAMIGFAPSLNKELSQELVGVAKSYEIPYQYEIMSGKTGTNADALGVSAGGKKTATVSIPIANMHTPVEVVDISDIENTAKLLAHFLCENIESEGAN